MTFESAKNTKALSLTIGIHLLLLLLFFFVKYQAVNPPELEQFDLELAAGLGTVDNGLGIDPPEMIMGAPAAALTADAGSSAAGGSQEAASSSETELHQDDVNDEVAATDHAHAAAVLKRAVSNNASNNTRTPVSNQRTNRTQAQSGTQHSRQTAQANSGRNAQASPKYTFNGSNGPGGNGADQDAPGATSRGAGTGTGLTGQPGGDPNSMSYTGGVYGRNIIAGPDRRAEFREGGRVRVKVWVNRDGTITRYSILSATNGTIRSITEQKIKAIRFNKLATAPVEQSGEIVINFKAGTGR